MSNERKATENEVFNQELSLDDLDAVSGGYDAAQEQAYGPGMGISGALSPGIKDADTTNCSNNDIRQIYGGDGFPNCAATVEDGSWCSNSDACNRGAVNYKGMNGCSQAWR